MRFRFSLEQREWFLDTDDEDAEGKCEWIALEFQEPNTDYDFLMIDRKKLLELLDETSILVAKVLVVVLTPVEAKKSAEEFIPRDQGRRFGH